MPADPLAHLLGCCCDCCRSARPAPQPPAGNLFQSGGRGTPALVLPDDAPFIPPSPVRRWLTLPLPERVPSIGLDTGTIDTRVNWTDGWAEASMAVPNTVTNANDVRYSAPTAYRREADGIYACAANLYQYRITLVRLTLPGMVQTTLATAGLLLGDESGSWRVAEAVVTRSGAGFTVYQDSRQSVIDEATATEYHYARVIEHHVSLNGDITVSVPAWTLIATVPSNAAPPDLTPILSGHPTGADVGLRTRSGVTLRDVPDPPLNVNYLGAWVPAIPDDVAFGYTPAVQGNGPITYSLMATVTARERLRGGVTLLTLDAWPVGLLTDWLPHGWAFDAPGSLPHVPGLLVPDPKGEAYKAHPPGTALTWADADRLKLPQGGPAWHFRVRNATETPIMGQLSVLSRPEWWMPAPLQGSEQFPLAVSVDAGTLLPALLPPEEPASRLTAPALTPRFTTRLTWTVPAGTSTLSVTFPPAPPHTRHALLSAALRGPWRDTAVQVRVNGANPAPQPLSARTWVQLGAALDPDAVQAFIQVTTPHAVTLSLAQLSVLRTAQASPV